ncbi:Protein DEL-8, partial [Aphelenchoides avenae]
MCAENNHTMSGLYYAESNGNYSNGDSNHQNGASMSLRRPSTVEQRGSMAQPSAECDCHSRDYPPWTGEIHGMSQALLSKSAKLRAFWWIVLFVCTSCGIYTTVEVIREYIRGPTATSTTIRLVPSLELPAITICPK